MYNIILGSFYNITRSIYPVFFRVILSQGIWAVNSDLAIDYKKEGGIAIFPYLSPFLIVRAPGSIRALWVVTCSAPVPFATVTQEYIHS
jgi:hypothetical protein